MSAQYYDEMLPSSWRNPEPVASMGPVYKEKRNEITQNIQESMKKKRLQDERKVTLPRTFSK